jgi:hypothetical protein
MLPDDIEGIYHPQRVSQRATRLTVGLKVAMVLKTD